MRWCRIHSMELKVSINVSTLFFTLSTLWIHSMELKGYNLPLSDLWTHKLLWIHSMELKVRLELLADSVARDLESIQWNWKGANSQSPRANPAKPGIHSMELKVHSRIAKRSVFDPMFIESIQWNWKLSGYLSPSQPPLTFWESIQWNWKAVISMLLIVL